MFLTHPQHSLCSFYFCPRGQRVNVVDYFFLAHLYFQRSKALSSHLRCEGQSKLTQDIFRVGVYLPHSVLASEDQSGVYLQV